MKQKAYPYPAPAHTNHGVCYVDQLPLNIGLALEYDWYAQLQSIRKKTNNNNNFLIPSKPSIVTKFLV